MAYNAFKINTIAAALISSGICSTAAHAQQTILEEVLVTAQKRPETMQEVPLSVNVIGGEMLQQARIFRSEDLVKLTPSLTLQDGGETRSSSFNIRGIGTQSFSSGVEPSVSTVVDGVVMGRSGMAFAQLMDISRVEILRGPQGTLFGKNASAGVVNILTNDPAEKFEASINTALEEDMYRVEGATSVPITDQLALRVAAMQTKYDGYVDNKYNGNDLNDSDNKAVRAKLRWSPTESLEIKLTGNYADSNGDCCQPTPRVTTDLLTPIFGFQEEQIAPVVGSKDNFNANVGADVFQDSDMSGTALEINWDISNYTVTSITAVQSWKIHSNVDVDGAPLNWLDLNEGKSKQDQFSQELRLASPAEDTLNYVIGAYFFDQKLDRDFTRQLYIAQPNPDTGSPGTSFTGDFTSTTKTTNYAFFGQFTYDLTTDFRLIAGARYTHDKLEFDFERTGQVLQGGALIPPQPYFEDDTSDDDTTYKLGAQWDISENYMAYATWSQGYKAEAYNIVFEMAPGTPPVPAETSEAYEIGLKTTLFDDRLILNTSAFYTTFQDFQSQAQDSTTGQFSLLSVGDVVTSGVEVDVLARPTANWDIFGGFAWIDTEIKDLDKAPCAPAQRVDPTGECALYGYHDVRGEGMPYSPKYKFSLSSRYLVPLDMSFDVALTGTYRWQDDVLYSIDQDKNKIQEAYGVLDLSIGLVDDAGRYEISVYVNNALDENYASAILQNNIFSAAVTGALPYDQYLTRDSERRVGLELRYFWM
ncbi:MAG: TonB-dependent receptor [Gammaproteobacteria bacterium]|jgi:iron complex outermembrane receptor protein|nr:TonB-dependent receptor [Gammaproteobacteria bacterium]MDH5171297.1 TonB-dependent receptor [Gammaproteobacteria bacterium]